MAKGDLKALRQAHKAQQVRRETETDRDVITGVFEVKDRDGKPGVYTLYVALEDNLSRGAAIPHMKDWLEAHGYREPKFHFWAEHNTASCGGPIRYGLDGSDVVWK
jgi:hypothetical protein